MRRLFLAVVLLVLAVLLIPPVRHRAQPRIDQFRTWAGERLEGPLSPVLTPYRNIRARSEIGRVVTDLVAIRNRGLPPPRASEFRDFMLNRGLSETGNDPWGSPYVLVQEPDSLGIRSAGADLSYETDDDIIVKVRFPTRPRRPLRRSR